MLKQCADGPATSNAEGGVFRGTVGQAYNATEVKGTTNTASPSSIADFERHLDKDARLTEARTSVKEPSRVYNQVGVSSPSSVSVASGHAYGSRPLASPVLGNAAGNSAAHARGAVAADGSIQSPKSEQGWRDRPSLTLSLGRDRFSPTAVKEVHTPTSGKSTVHASKPSGGLQLRDEFSRYGRGMDVHSSRYS